MPAKYLGVLLALVTTLVPTAYTYAAWENLGLNSTEAKCIHIAPSGIFVCENDNHQQSPSHYNGVLVSRDFGNSWKEAGLEKRGVVDITSSKNRIFAATKFTQQSSTGLFVSDNQGYSWDLVPTIDFPLTKLAAKDNLVLAGSSNRGLWVSQDLGLTWKQQLTDTYYGPGISEIKICATNVFVATTTGKLYVSTDTGDTFGEIVEFSGKRITSVGCNASNVLLGTTLFGAYSSQDSGKTWKPIAFFGNKAVGAITFFDQTWFVASINSLEQRTVFASQDQTSWTDTQLSDSLSFANVLELNGVIAKPKAMLAVTHSSGIKKLSTEDIFPKTEEFLQLPYQKKSVDATLLENITAVFDHEYPLLGYRYHNEPKGANTTTLNFLGVRAPQPDLYYSSHNGYDFALDFGENVLAAASGTLTYHYCTTCGHTLKINHHNGYQSTYMHLQSQGLITTQQAIEVTKGQVIGKVGLSGATSGPHLHFVVTKDKNANGNFNDDYPTGLVDPFGWHGNTADPWAFYNWADTVGTHQGSVSTYLWEAKLNTASEIVPANTTEEVTVETTGKKVTIRPEATLQMATVILNEFITPIVKQETLAYIPNTALVVELINGVGEKITTLLGLAQISISLENTILDNIILDTLRIYLYNEDTLLWELLENSVYDPQTKIIAGITNHFSTFAVFGQALDINPPSTALKVTPESALWYVVPPLVELTTENNATIFYTLANDTEWRVYTTPIILQNDGVYGLLYRSRDQYGNWEEIQEAFFRINKQGNARKVIKVSRGQFSVDGSTE